jgi:galactokinase
MPDAGGWAPGRVNLIGEHTDYNGGLVLPLALALGVGVRLTPSGALRVEGEDVDARSAAYVAAVCQALGVPDRVAVRVEADLPAGAGLASSAALELALARALRDLHGLDLGDRELALACHRAESEIVGVRCGVMDQLAAALAPPRHALFVDCRSLAATEVPLPPGLELAVLDSGVRHANAASGFNDRRAECEEAARLLGVPTLRELGREPRFGDLPDPLGRRARHVHEENERVTRALAALVSADMPTLAGLMRDSHASQRDLLDVSTAEVDELVACAERAGALAARLTGGGFGGAVVALCDPGRAGAVARGTGAPLLAAVSAV